MANMKQNRSMFNPTDMAAMKQGGEFSGNMTVRDVMAKLGIDVDGPATQLIEFGKKQTQNANPLSKMKNIASGAGTRPKPRPNIQAPSPGMARPQGAAPGMEGLLKGV